MKSVVSLCGIVGLVLFFSSCLKLDNPGPSLHEQWVKDTTAIGQHIRSNNIPALKDASGVYFVIESAGSGFSPKFNSSVSFTYTGKLISGSPFSQGNANGLVNGFNDGIQAALSLLPKGAKATFYIPSVYRDGAPGGTSVPANTNMIYEITMTDIVISEFDKQQLASDTVEIDNYLSQNFIDAVKDKSGLRYVIIQLGAGPQPALYNKVKFNYTGKLLASGTIFFTGTSSPSATFDSRVINYIHGFQAAFTRLPIGTKATLYVPSVLGFGDQSLSAVPANSNLIYEIELIELVE